MQKRPNLIIPAVIVGIVFLVLAVLYFAEPAKSLPSFIPGHEAGSTHHHVKHGIAARCWASAASSSPGSSPGRRAARVAARLVDRQGRWTSARPASTQ